MADITNLSSFLGDVADAIRTKKGSSDTIPAAEFDSEILAIETGVDTSDADATEENIESGKTAYVNGLKITGTLADAGGSADVMVSADNITVGNQRGWDCVSTTYTNSGKKIHKDGWYVNQHMKFEDLAPALGVTADKIVAGNTILGVEGTGESGGTTTGTQAKLFETVDEMNADENPKEGDIAVIYGSNTENMTKESEFTDVIFPDTVVLPSAVTTSSSCYIMGDSYESEHRVYLTASTFYLMNYYDYEYICRYTSDDGITYTRDTSYESTYTFSESVKYESGTWSDDYGYFIQCGSHTFDGLFRAESVINYKRLKGYRLSYSDDVLSYEEEEETRYDEIVEMMQAVANHAYGATTTKILCEVALIKDNAAYVVIRQASSSNSPAYAYNASGQLQLSLSAYNSSYPATWYIYSYNFTDNSLSRYSTYTNTTSSSVTKDTGIMLDGYLCVPLVYQPSTGAMREHDGSFYAFLSTGSGNLYNDFLFDIVYNPAQTQFTLEAANELLPGRIALGANGTVEGDGSIYNNLDGQKVTTDLLGMSIGATDYLAKAANNKLSYFKFDALGTTSLVKTNYFKYLEYYTKYKEDTYSTAYYGFTYLTDDGKTYVYMSVDNEIVFVDTETEESTAYPIIKASQWYSISLAKCPEKLFYVNSSNKLCIFDCVTKEIVTTSFTASSLYSLSVIGDSKYTFIGLYLSSSSKYLIAVNNETNSIITQLSTSGICDVHKTPSTYYVTTQSTNILYKFTGTGFTQLRSGGFSIGLQSSGFAFEDSTFLYCPYRTNSKVVKVYKSGSSANVEAAVTSNNELSMIPYTTLPLSDGTYLVAGKNDSGEYFYCRCNVSVKSSTLYYEEIDTTNRWEIPYNRKWYDDINSADRALSGLPNYMFTTFDEQEGSLRFCRNDSSTSGSYPDSFNDIVRRVSVGDNSEYDVCGINDYKYSNTSSSTSYFFGYHLFKENTITSEEYTEAIETANEILGEEV